MTLSYFVYLPWDFYHNDDLGYAFVNIQNGGFQGSGLFVERLVGLFGLVFSKCQAGLEDA